MSSTKTKRRIRKARTARTPFRSRAARARVVRALTRSVARTARTAGILRRRVQTRLTCPEAAEAEAEAGAHGAAPVDSAARAFAPDAARPARVPTRARTRADTSGTKRAGACSVPAKCKTPAVRRMQRAEQSTPAADDQFCCPPPGSGGAQSEPLPPLLAKFLHTRPSQQFVSPCTQVFPPWMHCLSKSAERQ
jgi:hypothetical protein